MVSLSGDAATVRAVLFDRDGTLVWDVPYNDEPNEVTLKNGALQAVHGLRQRGLRIGVVTNQSGIGRGLLKVEDVERVNQRIDAMLGTLDTWQMCPHAPSDGCSCRKPAPGLLVRAASSLSVSPGDLLLVGDRLADLGAARSVGAISVLVPSAATERGAESVADHVLTCLSRLPALVDTLRGA